MTELGLDISVEKNIPRSTQCICLGVLVDTVQCTVSVPQEKLEEIKRVCQNWAQKSYCTKNQLQSLLGSLLYVSKCVKQSRLSFFPKIKIALPLMITLKRHSMV